ncbi:SDR family oxidoreductase [Nocardioides sp. LMS-CY]|uniref:mycofactocin-coupled SDR family oxidoreductase n=1 Tax=Nocardioides sp. (strain LMS-CY) TaxID=2840457 RepID=UPI001C0042AC|nr:mycofactocin-coupled SDR family oxidoreductase [Nocardioides sp. LMS-CY]QWF22564.1 SDR family oxidoreductase [Nocardioides sp. LMS-CY]
MRVALVTGAAGGIGSATVARLLAQGYAVVGVDREAAVVPESERAAHVRGDVRDQRVLESAVALAVERWGRLDAVVAAAAVIAGGRPLWETPLEEVYDLWEADARTVWQTAVAAVPVMLAGPDPSGCRFVAVASAAAHQGLFGLGAYVAAKHAVVGLVKGLAADLVGTGVTACAVSPGSTRTPMLDATADIYGLTDAEAFAGHQLLRRLLDPDEVAATLAFCCSREAAVLNGSVVSATGGFS